jgi:hypothetical protein
MRKLAWFKRAIVTLSAGESVLESPLTCCRAASTEALERIRVEPIHGTREFAGGFRMNAVRDAAITGCG